MNIPTIVVTTPTPTAPTFEDLYHEPESGSEWLPPPLSPNVTLGITVYKAAFFKLAFIIERDVAPVTGVVGEAHSAQRTESVHLDIVRPF
ncbi:hypothetical protein J7T55_003314 [Diaporthe amygdali]|uniref:uncharacterized protein n=1 Tax=Phomopsis amygdali TaxID=1214568 RepID=UPI0022FEB514|nr:uncharacterized protein J7T55_003314 [Diaporthe amygdali]KAJ0116900.1 hypothetical protein J7T55_003314 [Diaporthe amygdali]